MSIIVVDSIMGSGKSTWAFKTMRSNPQKKYIYVTPFLDECERAIDACAAINMVQPKEAPTKQADFIRLISSGMNVATTHSLFARQALSQADIERIREMKYTLIIDEVFDTVQIYDRLKKKDLLILEKNGYIQIDSKGVIRPAEGKNLNDWAGTPYNDVQPFIQAGNLVNSNNKLLLQLFSPRIFDLAQDTYIMTYLFEASHLKRTLDINHQKYETRWIDKTGELTTEYQDYRDLKRQYKRLIHIYEGSKNYCGKSKGSLSATSWKRYSESHRKEIMNVARGYFMASALKRQAPASKCMWAVYGESKKELNGTNHNKTRRTNISGYSTACVPFNERATNQYRDRYVLAYMVNVYEHVIMKTWFQSKGAKCNDDQYALSTLLQWIWRSRIRDGKDIYLFLPSQRMRDLLKNWLNSR